MLKFIKGHMESIDGIAIYPIISFVIFFGFFLILGIAIYLQRNDYFEQMAKMPLDDSEPNDENTTRHE